MQISTKIMLISELKYWVLHMLEQTGYTQMFGQGVIQEIVHMLTGACAVEKD